jgi:kynurenine formamidase
VVVDLAIGYDEMREHLSQCGKLQGKFVIFHTGWADQFMPRGADLSSITNELFVPWLVHPWLTPKAARFLMDQGPAVVGVDCPMLDCPVYISANVSPSPRVRAVAEKVFAERFDAGEGRPGLRLHDLQPLHSQALPRGVMLVENMDIRDDPCAAWYAGRLAVETQAFLVFLSHSLLMDAAICKILLRKPQ